MEPLDAIQQVMSKVLRRHSKARASGAGIIDAVILGGVLWIDADTRTFSSRQNLWAIPLPLGEGIEGEVITDGNQFLYLLLWVSGAEDVGLATKLLASQLGLKESTGGGTRQILTQNWLGGEHGESLLRQENFTARPLCHGLQDFQVPP